MFFPRLISHTRHTGAHLWSVDAQGEWSIVSREVQPLGILCFRPILMANGFWEAAFSFWKHVVFGWEMQNVNDNVLKM